MMIRSMRRFFGAAAVFACLVCLPPQALAERDLTVDDIVALEGFGRATIAPSGRWAVYEKRGAYDTIPRYDYVQRSTWTITDLWRVDLRSAAPRPERLLPDEPLGLLRGDWSPDGSRLTVFRFSEDRYELGVADVAARRVKWTGLAPELPGKGAPIHWTPAGRLIVAIRPDGSLPALLAHAGAPQKKTSEAWRRTSEGRAPSRTVLDTDKGVPVPETRPPENRLVELEVETGRVLRTLFTGTVTDVVLSPDGLALAVLAGAEALPLGNPVVQFDEPFRQRLRLIRLADGREIRPEALLDVGAQMLRWSPDSKALLFWAREDDQVWDRGGLRSMDLDGRLRTWPSDLDLGGDANILRGVRAEWLDGAPVVYGRAPDSRRQDWHHLDGSGGRRALTTALEAAPYQLAAAPGDGSLRLFADGGYWRMDAQGLRGLSPPQTTLRPVMVIDSERPRRVIWETPRRTTAAALAGGQVMVASDAGLEAVGAAGDEDTQIMAASPDAVLVLERDEMVETLRLRRGGEDEALDVVNEARADVSLIQPEWLDHPDGLGEPGRSTLFLPRGPAKGLIVSVYPGHVDDGGWYGPLVLTYNVRAAVLVGAGYAVLHPAMPYDRPGTRSWAFFEASIDRAVDAAFAAHPELPRNRTAIFGHSFGGYIGLAVATRSKRYQSYVLSSAPTDLFAHWGEFSPPTRILPENGMTLNMQQGWVETGQGETHATPWAAPEVLMRESPWLKADQIGAPVLLLTADMDFVTLSGSEKVFSALARLGGRARLVTYWGEHHARWSPANIRDQYDQIFDWLEETLPPATKEVVTPVAVFGPETTDDPPRSAPSPHRPPPPGSPHSGRAR